MKENEPGGEGRVQRVPKPQEHTTKSLSAKSTTENPIAKIFWVIPLVVKKLVFGKGKS
jgi:hypothetical protein